jgi:hypothetical protein
MLAGLRRRARCGKRAAEMTDLDAIQLSLRVWSGRCGQGVGRSGREAGQERAVTLTGPRFAGVHVQLAEGGGRQVAENSLVRAPAGCRGADQILAQR